MWQLVSVSLTSKQEDEDAIVVIMMTPSNGNIFCVTSILWGEFTGDQRRGALTFCSIYSWTNGWVNNRNTGDLRRHRTHYDGNGKWWNLDPRKTAVILSFSVARSKLMSSIKIISRWMISMAIKLLLFLIYFTDRKITNCRNKDILIWTGTVYSVA